MSDAQGGVTSIGLRAWIVAALNTANHAELGRAARELLPLVLPTSPIDARGLAICFSFVHGRSRSDAYPIATVSSVNVLAHAASRTVPGSMSVKAPGCPPGPVPCPLPAAPA